MGSSRAEKISQPDVLSVEGNVTASRRVITTQVSPRDASNVLLNTAARHSHGNKSQLDLITDGAHESKTTNPHQVTKDQVGLGAVPDTDFTVDVEANSAHRSLVTGNPHEVTKADVGLGNVQDGATPDQTKEDIEALGVSHDSLSDVSADDHHAQVHTIASHSDIASTGADLDNAVSSVEELILQTQWTESSGIIEGGAVSAGTTAGTFKVDAITKALLRTAPNSTAPLVSVTLGTQDNQTIPNVDIVYYVAFNYGIPCSISLSTSSLNGFDSIPIGKTLKTSDGTVHFISGGYRFNDGIRKLHQRAMMLRALELRHGGMIAYSGTNNFTLSSGVAFGGINEFFLSSYDSADTQFTAIHNNSSGGWTEVKMNAIDYAHYDSLTDTLGVIKNNKYGVHYIFKHIDDQGVFTVYGLGSYSLAEAVLQATQVPNIPLHLSEFGVIVGSVIVSQVGGSFVQIISSTEQAFDNTEVANHANLSNLDYSTAGHTGFANSGTNNNISSMTGLSDAGIPLSKVDGATSYPGTGENAFLDADKSNLDNNTTHRSITSGNPHQVTKSDIGLGNVQDGAQVNVQSNWNESDTGSDAYIQNKPDLSSVGDQNVQADWDESDTGSDAYIQNKPSVITSTEREAITANTTHRSQTDNPHQVTKAQVGLGDVPNTDFTSAVNANTTHRETASGNPHQVTKSDVGLGNVLNTDLTSEVNANTNKRHTQGTDGGTVNNTFIIGDGFNSDKTLYANIDSTNKPGLRYNSSWNAWTYSNDGETYIPVGYSVQADWDESDTGSDAYIQNKPDVITDTERSKLNSIETGAKNYPHSGEQAFTDTFAGKLNGIAYNAEVNVQSDWNETNSGADSFIQNKPVIPVIPGDLHFERVCTSSDNASTGSSNSAIRCSFSTIITNTFNQTTNNLFTCQASGIYVFNFLAAFNGVDYGQVGSIGTALICPNYSWRIEWHPASGNDSGQIHSRNLTICVHLTAGQTVYPSLEKWGGGAINFLAEYRSMWSGYCVSLD